MGLIAYSCSRTSSLHIDPEVVVHVRQYALRDRKLLLRQTAGRGLLQRHRDRNELGKQGSALGVTGTMTSRLLFTQRERATSSSCTNRVTRRQALPK
jgi:hypothetical protein